MHSRFSCAIGANIYVKVLCLVIVKVNVTKYNATEMSKMPDLWLSGMIFQAPNTPNLVFGRGSAPDPAGELTALPQTLAGLRGTYF